MRSLGRTVASMVLVCAAGCYGGPTSPSRTPVSAPVGEPFEVAGVVTDDTGRPLPGIAVGMRYWLGGFIQSPVAITDASGAYAIAFAATAWTESRGRAAARAELIADGYEWYYRTVYVPVPKVVENFRLHPLQRIMPGGSVALPMSPDDGQCVTELSWTLATACRTVRVTASVSGVMTVEAIAQGSADQPLVSVCCVLGDDRGGNPVTLPVTAGTDYTLEVGLLSGFARQVVLVKTSFVL